MKFAIRRPRVVEEDQLAAALWYDTRQPGLGDAFLDESESVISSLSRDAEIHSVRFADVRCVRLSRFRPYGVYYLIHGGEVLLLAIHHAARHPHWLRERRKETS